MLHSLTWEHRPLWWPVHRWRLPRRQWLLESTWRYRTPAMKNISPPSHQSSPCKEKTQTLKDEAAPSQSLIENIPSWIFLQLLQIHLSIYKSVHILKDWFNTQIFIKFSWVTVSFLLSLFDSIYILRFSTYFPELPFLSICFTIPLVVCGCLLLN